MQMYGDPCVAPKGLSVSPIEILKSKANEAPKLLSSSGIRNQRILNFEVMVVRDKATIAFVEKYVFFSLFLTSKDVIFTF